MSQASEYLETALQGLDEQWKSLVDRVGKLADEVSDARGDEAAMSAAADRLSALATQAGQLALPSEVADPDNPAEAGPLPEEEPEPNLPAADNGPMPEPTPEPVEPGAEPPAEGQNPTGVY